MRHTVKEMLRVRNMQGSTTAALLCWTVRLKELLKLAVMEQLTRSMISCRESPSFNQSTYTRLMVQKHGAIGD